MAGFRDDRRQMLLPEPVPGRRAGALALALAAVLAAIALLWNVSRRPAHQAPVATETVETLEPAAVAPPPAPEPAPEPAAAVNPAPASEDVGSTRNQAEVARVIRDGRPSLTACYQRALSRDNTLVQARLTVRVSIAASGRVTHVAIRGPAAFRELEPCLEQAISRWTFPAESEAYVAELPIAFRGKE